MLLQACIYSLDINNESFLFVTFLKMCLSHWNINASCHLIMKLVVDKFYKDLHAIIIIKKLIQSQI